MTAAHSLLPPMALLSALLHCTPYPPAALGVRDGALAPCPRTPNFVSTGATDARHRMPPLAYSGAPGDALARLRAIVAACPRARVVEASERYLRAEFRSRVFRFVDDVEFLADPAAQVVHFRSASRLGRSDFGVNRRRMETIARKFAAAGSPP